MTALIFTTVVGLLAAATQALAQDDPTQPVIIRLPPMSSKPRFLSEVSAPRAVQAPMVPPASQNAAPAATSVAQPPLPPSPPAAQQQPVYQQTAPPVGALTNNTYSPSFTTLKFYREGNPNGSPRFALGYGFKSGETGQFVLHSSNSPDAEPFWVIKKGPLNEYNQYDYAIISTWVRFPVFVIARDPERFRKEHMKNVLQFLEDNNYINVMTKAFNMISPVDYEACQYTPTFSTAG
nr:Hypothetical protein CBG08134 [Haemonchus contortus]